MTTARHPTRVHFIAGGFPRGSAAGHDIDYARLRILSLLQEDGRATTTVAADYVDLEDWLPSSELLITYVAGPFPDEAQCALLDEWLRAGGRWLALHGTSGGKTVPLADESPGRMMLRGRHHASLGCFFLNHPPIRKFRVDVRSPEHPLLRALPDSFEVADELYLIEIGDPARTEILLSTSDVAKDDPAPRKFGFSYDEDTSVEEDGLTRPLGYVRKVGDGAIAYFALGHCHTPATNIQPWVDESVDPEGKTPLEFRGPWETAAFGQLLRNGIDWGIERL